MDDPRFRHIAYDPRFKAVPRKKRKVVVDSRFKSMFTEERFQVNYQVDKRGSAVEQSTAENLRKYYDLAPDEINSTTENGDVFTEATAAALVVRDEEEKEQDEEISEGEEAEESEDEASDTSSTDIEEEDLLNTLEKSGILSEWLDETGTVQKSDATSCRLALCNMNWDRINATDLFVLFNSFKPLEGVVKSVSIYLSDFGRERLKEEERQGPQELVEGRLEEEEDPSDYKEEEFSHEKLREYQLRRLQYYYAIIECDSAVTAEHIYNECDGLEFELSSSTLDLRFVPDEMSFADCEPSSIATEASLTKDYKPPEFMTSALQQSKVQLTWDETHPSRLKTTMNNYKGKDLSSVNFDDYLASSSEDEQEAWSKEESVRKYRSLLGLKNDSSNEEAEKGEELEIAWDIGLNENITPKQKRIDARIGSKESESQSIANTEEDRGFDDPFFTQKKVSKKKKKVLSQEEEKQAQKEKEELELLLISDTEDNSREHFNLKQIMKEEKKESAKKKRRKRKEKDTQEPSIASEFQIDLNDPRFSAVYDSHHYAIEPSSHHFKPTKGMVSLLSERQKRRKTDIESVEHKASIGSSSSLNTLVNSVKAKANLLKKARKRSLNF